MARTTKIMISPIIVGASIIALIICLIFLLIRSGEVTTQKVRASWKETPLANSPYFEVEEISEKAEKDRIYLKVTGIKPESAYVCHFSPSSRYCQLEVDDASYRDYDGQGFSLSTYFWTQNEARINLLLNKYTKNLKHKYKSGLKLDIYNNDTDTAINFVRDFLEIPDIQRLYLAYRAETNRTSSKEACDWFGEYLLDFYSGDSNATPQIELYHLFEYAMEHDL